MKKVLMLASELKCSIVTKDMASHRSLVSFLKGKGMIGECQVYTVDLRIGDAKAIEIAFSDAIFDEAVKIEGQHTTVYVPSEFADKFREVVP
jgi:hypothetical protein